MASALIPAVTAEHGDGAPITDVLVVGSDAGVALGADATTTIHRVGLPSVAGRRRRYLRGWRLDHPTDGAELVVVLPDAAGADPVPSVTAAELRRTCRSGGLVVVVHDTTELDPDVPGPDRRIPLLAAGWQILERSRSLHGEREVVVARNPPRDARGAARRLVTSGTRRRVAAAVATAGAMPDGPAGARLADLVAARQVLAADADLDGLDRSASLWDAAARSAAAAPPEISQRHEWQAHPRSQDHMRARAGGGFASWLARHVGRNGGHAVSIGCGRATTEVDLVANGQFDTIDLFDISSGSLDVARERAAEKGVADRVTCHVGAFDPALVTRPADAVLFLSSLHHIEALEEVLDGVAEVLVPGGVLVADEYVGPTRFGFPDDHLRHARGLFRIADRTLRRPDPELVVPTVEEVAEVDPTEAVRSDEILGQLAERFVDLEVAPIGGGLVFPLWYGLRHDALFETARGDALVEWILDLDATLTDAGVLPPYFAYLAARTPDGPAEDPTPAG